MSGNPLPPPTLPRAADSAERVASARAPAAGAESGRFSLPAPAPWLLGVLLVALTLFAYQPVWDAGFIWDDDDYVTHNPLLAADDGWSRIWFSTDAPSQYFPLTYSVLRLEYSLWGLNATGYHWVNLLLHAANALLAWRLLRRIAVPGAWLAAAIFALHPVQVESVAWVTELKNVLSLAGFLVALRCWVEFTDARGRAVAGWYAASLAAFALALAAKTTACTLPAALVLVLWWRRQPLRRGRLLAVLPYLVLGVGMGLLTVWWERTQQGTAGADFGLGFSERVLIASRAVWFHLGKFLWPAELAFSYPRWSIDVTDVRAYLWPLAGVVLAVLIAATRKRLGRALESAAIFYVAMLSPLLGFFMLYTFRYSFVADHYQYVALLAPAALVAGGLHAGMRHRSARVAVAATLAAVTLVAALGIATWRQSGIYENRETLWRATLAANPESFLAHHNLAAELLAQGNTEEAWRHAQAALALRPTGPDLALAHVNLGNACLQRHDRAGAITHFRRAIAVEAGLAEAHDNLGRALLDSERTDEAITSFETALRLQPAHANAHRNLGDALYRNGRYAEAADHFARAAVVRSDDATLQNNLGSARLQVGDAAAARAAFERAVALEAGFAPARRNLAFLLLHLGEPRAAAEHFRILLRADRDDSVAGMALAWLLATSSDDSLRSGSDALRIAQRLKILTHDRDPAVLRIVAAASAEVGQFADAVATAERARRLAAANADSALVTAIEHDLRGYGEKRPVRDEAGRVGEGATSP